MFGGHPSPALAKTSVQSVESAKRMQAHRNVADAADVIPRGKLLATGRDLKGLKRAQAVSHSVPVQLVCSFPLYQPIPLSLLSDTTLLYQSILHSLNHIPLHAHIPCTAESIRFYVASPNPEQLRQPTQSFFLWGLKQRRAIHTERERTTDSGNATNIRHGSRRSRALNHRPPRLLLGLLLPSHSPSSKAPAARKQQSELG